MSREKADNQKLTEIELRRLQHNLTCRRGSTREKNPLSGYHTYLQRLYEGEATAITMESDAADAMT